MNSSSPRIIYGQEGANEYFYISSLSANGVERGGVSVTIYCLGGKKVYMLTPKDPMLPRNKIVIGDFDEREDKLDLSLISGIRGMKDLAYVTHPLTFRTPDEQLIVLSSHMRLDLVETNFVFSSDSSSASKSSSYFIKMMSSASFLTPMILMIVGCGLVMKGEELLLGEERIGLDKCIEAHKIPLVNSGVMIDDKNDNNTGIQESDLRSLLSNVSDGGEDREKVDEGFDRNNIVKEGVEAVSSG